MRPNSYETTAEVNSNRTQQIKHNQQPRNESREYLFSEEPLCDYPCTETMAL